MSDDITPARSHGGFGDMTTLALLMKGVEADRINRTDEQGIVSAGQLAATLQGFDPTAPVYVSVPEALPGEEAEFYSTGQFGPGIHPIDNRWGPLGSYRGYYSDLYLPIADTDEDDPIGCADLLNKLQTIIGETIEGYKGGDYTVTQRTPVWASRHGDTGGLMVVGAVQLENERGSYVVIETKREVWGS